MQQQNAVSWVHQDPVAKSQRVTNSSGTVVSTIELDPWGGNTNRSNNDAFQPRKFTSYERDGNGSDEAMFRRYNRWWSRFDQPDPYGGSYNLGDPQSFNRYAYVQNDPVNFVDPTGLLPSDGQCQGAECAWSGGGGGFWGGGFNLNDRRSLINPSGRDTITEAEYDHDYRYGLENGPFRFRSSFLGTSWSGFYPQDTEKPKDCHEFANEVERMAAVNTSSVNFKSELYNRFSGKTGEFGSDGFRTDFQDYGGSPDQARHYVGGFLAGFLGNFFGGEGFGARVANLARETSVRTTLVSIPFTGFQIPAPVGTQAPGASQAADRALNSVSGRHGAMMHRGAIKPSDLAGLIRNEVCAARP